MRIHDCYGNIVLISTLLIKFEYNFWKFIKSGFLCNINYILVMISVVFDVTCLLALF